MLLWFTATDDDDDDTVANCSTILSFTRLFVVFLLGVSFYWHNWNLVVTFVDSLIFRAVNVSYEIMCNDKMEKRTPREFSTQS